MADDATLTELPSFVDQRPEFYVFGETIPFAGFYARHVRHLKLSEVRIQTALPEARPAVVCSDVTGLIVRGADFIGDFNGPEQIRLTRVENARVSQQ